MLPAAPQIIATRDPCNEAAVDRQAQGSIFHCPKNNTLTHRSHASGRAVRLSCLNTTPVDSHRLVVHATGSSARMSKNVIWPSGRLHSRQMQDLAHATVLFVNTHLYRDVIQITIQIGLEIQAHQIHLANVPPIAPTTTHQTGLVALEARSISMVSKMCRRALDVASVAWTPRSRTALYSIRASSYRCGISPINQN